MADKPAALFVDLSSNNPTLDVAAYAKAGHRIVALKATEGDNYRWTYGLKTAADAHKAGLTVLWYHFARPGSGVAQADYFLSHIARHVKPGDGLVIDCEVPKVNGRLVTAWLNRVHAKHPNLQLWVYGSAYFLKDNGIKSAHGAKLWIAGYPTYPLTPPGWEQPDAHQFTDAGTVAGMRSKVDVSRLLAAPAPAPKPHNVSTAGLTKKQRSMIRQAIDWFLRRNRRSK